MPLLICLSVLSGRTRDLDAKEARRLAIEALDPGQRKLPGLNAALSQRLDIPGFYRFEVLWKPTNPGSAVVGFFAVNRVTGQVWELVRCSEKKSRNLARLQGNMHKAIGLSPEELRSLGHKAPCEP